MRLKLDESKCVNCNACINACPQLADVREKTILSCNHCGSCAKVCVHKAFYEVDGILKIDPEKCVNCGDCVKTCSKKAIVQQTAFPAKCDLCLDYEKPLCVSACVYGALTLELDDLEKEKMREVVGWRKTNACGKSVYSDEFCEVVKDDEKTTYVPLVKEPSYDETLVAESIINIIRKNETHSPAMSEEILGVYCNERHLIIEDEQRRSIVDFVNSETSGFSVLDFMIKDENLEEISVISHEKPVYVYHKKFGWLETNIVIYNEQKIKDIINRLGRSLGRRVTLQKPRMNANIALGRVHAAISPITADGSCITIRKFNSRPFTPKELVDNKTITNEALAFLKMAIQCDVNVLLCGNTGSGKTSTLNTLFSFIPENERIVAIEETPEIMLSHKHLVRLNVTENTAMHDLVEDTLRMRPDRIIVGEVRTPKEVSALINTMLAGQGKSSFATFHSQNSEEALLRLMNLGISLMDLHALDLIIVQRRWTDLKEKKDLRRITEISCLTKEYSEKPSIVKIFDYDFGKKKLVPKKITDNAMAEKICMCFGITKKELEKEITRSSHGF